MFNPRIVVNRQTYVLYTLLVQHSVAPKHFITVFIQLDHRSKFFSTIFHIMWPRTVSEKCYMLKKHRLNVTQFCALFQKYMI